MSLLKSLKQNKRLISLVEFLVIMVVFMFTERTIRNNYYFFGTYRMQTVSKYLTLLFTIVLYILLAYFISQKKISSYGILIPYFVIYFGYFIATTINNASMDRWCDALIYSAAPMVLSILVLKRETMTKKYIKSATIVFTILSLSNLILELYPQLWIYITEWRDECFFGYHTLIGWPLTLGLLFALLDGELSGKKTLMIINIALYFANIFIIRPGGAVVGALISALWLAIPFVKKQFNKRSLLPFIWIALILFIVLMWIFEPFTSFPPVKLFIENVLHRNITLSGRLYVWDGVKKLVSEKPLFGYGFQESTQIFFEDIYNHADVHAHNMFLQCLYEGGTFTLIMGIGMLVYTSFAVKKDQNDFDNKSAKDNFISIFNMIIFNLLIMLQSDQDTYYNWYILAFVCNLYIVMMRGYSFNGKEE